MSCVNEQCFGPLHLLVRESGGSATGSKQPACSYRVMVKICSKAVVIYNKDKCVSITLSLY